MPLTTTKRPVRTLPAPVRTTLAPLIRTPLSAPAKRVGSVVDVPVRFSRTLDELNPYTRSSTAAIVPMPSRTAFSPFDRAVILAGAVALGVVIGLGLLGLF